MNTQNNMYSLTKCFSIKCKYNPNTQCINKRKNNSFFCGVHSKMNNPVIFKPIIDDGLYDPLSSLNENNENIKIVSSADYDEFDINMDVNNNILLDFDSLLALVNNSNECDNIKVFILRRSIKNSGLKNIINTKQSKQLIINDLINYFNKYRLYVQYLPQINIVQKYVRRWLILRRKVCINNVDILTMDNKYCIPTQYFYQYTDVKTNNKFAYDIRTLVKILEDTNPKCPYTMVSFEMSDVLRINSYINSIKYRLNLDIDKPIVSPEKNVELRMIDIFHKINLLDNYTNHEWFKYLNVEQLQDLYIKAEDIWNYRAQLSQSAKCKIVTNGKLFTMPIHYIKNSFNLLKMQHIILDEFERAITEGVNLEERKLGAILMLTALVDVSPEAGNALHHLVQIN